MPSISFSLSFPEIRDRNMGIEADGAAVAAEYQEKAGLRHKIVFFCRRNAFQYWLYLFLVHGGPVIHIVDCLRLNDRIGNCLFLPDAIPGNSIRNNETHNGCDCKQGKAV